ncbi:MAG TPA: hypothetical protein VEF53_21165, partial [Patescibacteria group bacterium]|nr:hypothetical protein [Patescibacteria group bacterium]
ESIIFFTTQDIKLIEDLSDNIVMISKGEIAFKGNLASFSLLAEKTRFEITLDYNTNEDLFYRLKDLLKREDFNVIDNKTIIGNFTNSDFNAIMSFIYANGFAINRISKDEFTNSYNNALK